MFTVQMDLSCHWWLIIYDSYSIENFVLLLDTGFIMDYEILVLSILGRIKSKYNVNLENLWPMAQLTYGPVNLLNADSFQEC